MLVIPLGPWTPDLPALRDNGLIMARNVVPMEDGSYAPLRSISAITEPLPSPCRGILAARSTDGNIQAYAGTSTLLYRLSAGRTWVEQSIGTYALGDEDRWRFAVFGDTIIAVGGISVDTQYGDLSLPSADFSDVSGAPRARYVAVVRDHLFLAYTYDDDDEAQPGRVWYSALGNPLSWPTPGTIEAVSAQSSFFQLSEVGAIQGILAHIGGTDAAIWAEDAIYRTAYEGPPTVYRVDPVETARGAYIPGSIVAVGRIGYYFSKDGWYAFDGVQSTPIGVNQIDRWFLNDLDHNYLHKVFATKDVDRKLIFWSYPGADNVSGECNRLLIYNYVAGTWTYGDMATQALAEMMSTGYTLEELDAFGNLDELQFSLDSPVWAGGGAYLGAVDSTGALGSFSGDTLQADLTRCEAGDPSGGRVFFSGLRTYGDATCTCAIDYRDTEQAALATSTYRGADLQRWAPCRQSTRYVRPRFRVAAGQDWTNLHSFDARSARDGLR